MTKQEHYYSKNPTSDFKTFELDYFIRDKSYKFTSAAGVFSKHAVDFGSNLLIKAVSEDINKCSTILDIGCGYGVIGIVLSDLLGAKATLCDINDRAILLAKKNSKSYNTDVLQSDGLDDIRGVFDVIVTNPPIRAGKDVYYKWFENSFEHLNKGGSFYCVIQKKQGAPSAKNKLTEVYGNCEFMAKDKGYFILKSVK